MEQQNDVKEAERRKMFSTVQQESDAGSKIQAIKKASIFADVQYKNNIKEMMRQSEELKMQQRREEEIQKRIKE